MDTQLTFRGQREDELVIHLIHRHPWALAKPALITTVGIVLIILMFVWFKLSNLSAWFFFIVGGVTAAYAVHHWFIWWNNLYILTNQRVIIVSQRSIWHRKIEDYGLEKIQSVASSTNGPMQAMLNFGDVLLVVVGMKEPVSMPFIEDARSVQEAVLDAMKRGSMEPIRINSYDGRSETIETPKKAEPEAGPKKKRRLIVN